MAQRHNQLGVAEFLDLSAGEFSVQTNNDVRPYRLLNSGRFATAYMAAIHNQPLRQLSLCSPYTLF